MGGESLGLGPLCCSTDSWVPFPTALWALWVQVWPSILAMAATWDPVAVQELGAESFGRRAGGELREAGCWVKKFGCVPQRETFGS